MPLYSHSRLSCFEQCPLKFKFAYIDELETEIEETVESFLGTRVHEVLEKLYKDLKFQKIPSLKELLEFYNEQWKKNWNESIIIVKDEYGQENYRKMGEKYITDYYNSYKPFNQSRTLLLETKRTVELDKEDRYHIHIRIDRLAMADDNTYEIHDYKTTNTLPTQKELDKDRQLAIYAYGVKRMFPDAEKIRLVWHFLAFNKEMSSKRTKEQLEKLRNEVLKLIKDIEGCEEFPARESALCDWCEFQQYCPRFKHLFEVDEKPANEYLKDSGVKLVNKFAELSERIRDNQDELEKVREALIAFAGQKGVEVVYGSDVKASLRRYEQLSFPKKGDADREAFFNALKKIGLWDQLAAPDVYELAKMINNKELHDELLKLVEKFIERNEVVRVNLRRK